MCDVRYFLIPYSLFLISYSLFPMAVHFHTLKVKSVNKETPDCVSIEFDIPETLLTEFAFSHGQNITIKKTIGGEEIRRSYSICTAPFEKRIAVAVKKVDDGRFSFYAN